MASQTSDAERFAEIKAKFGDRVAERAAEYHSRRGYFPKDDALTVTTELVLKDRYSGNRVFLTLRDGVVVGAMGCEPQRYVGLAEQDARHKARFAHKP
jgi:hypothetical protein